MREPRDILVVGVGFVGSVFLEEYLKHCFAGEQPRSFHLIDGDTFERRNAANQNVPLRVASTQPPKAEVGYTLCKNYERIASWEQEYVTAENIEQLLDELQPWVIVDAVDNLKARTLLYERGLGRNIPVLHIGIAEDGTGTVEWSHPEHDRFSLAPQRRIGKPELVDPESGVTPPCELARMRGVGLNVSHAAALSLSIFFGFDPYSFLAGTNTRGYMTEWRATPTSFFPVQDTWEVVESAVAVPEEAE